MYHDYNHQLNRKKSPFFLFLERVSLELVAKADKVQATLDFWNEQVEI